MRDVQIIGQDTFETRDHVEQINKLVPLKASLFIWGLLINKLPSMENLLHLSMISYLEHLFFDNHQFGQVWYDILSWLGIFFVLSNVALEHGHQFSGLVFVLFG